MTLRLATRLASRNVYSRENVTIDRGEMRSFLAARPIMVLDDVASFYADHDQDVWENGDFPNVAPPFSGGLFEWIIPDTIRLNGEVSQCPGGQAGSIMLAMDLKQSSVSVRELQCLMSERYGGDKDKPIEFKDKQQWDDLVDAHSKSRWIMFLDHFVVLYEKPHCGRPVFLGTHDMIFGDDTGRCIHYVSYGIARAKLLEIDVNVPSYHRIVVSLGISFMHCKNVEIQESSDLNESRQWHQRTKTPTHRFYTLKIDPMRKILRTDGESEKTGIKRALHICRGHFATYTEERPLFGMVAGTFFKQAHVRGSKEYGMVTKDYSVGASEAALPCLDNLYR